MIRFFNGICLSFHPNVTLSDKEVWVDHNNIIYVGPAREDMPLFEREINLNGNLIMPGFKNAHSHTAMNFLRSYSDELPLKEWLSKICWPNEAKLTDEAVYNLTKIGIMEYLTSGITACFDMYMHNDAYVQAMIDCGFRTVICSALNDFDQDITNIEREYIRFNHLESDLISYMLGIHAEYTTSMERIQYMVSLCNQYHAPAFTHLSETKDEVESCIQRYSMTPPQLLYEVGLFKYGGGGFHCCYMTDEDIKMFADKGLYAITNPASNLKLASGIAPVEKMRLAGVKIAIGTDGAASNNALDFFREIYLTSTLQKLISKNAAACPASEILKMACVNGAEAMGLTDSNNLTAGKKADLIVIDLHQPNMRPLNNIANNIVYAGSKSNVIMTMVGGKILYENGKFFINDDVDRIYSNAQKFVSHIL